MKKLRVCLSKDLPDTLDRSKDYLYFTYDNLYLYSGQNQLSDNFAIVESVPEDAVYGLIYIVSTDGSVHRKIDYRDTKIAEIEEESQLELLRKAGTMFYVNSAHRYFDHQRRILTLPFNDGTYELAVAAKNDAVFNNNTILKYNEKTERFEMYGEQDEEFIDFSKPFRGAKTDTMSIKVDGPRISANVILSKLKGNALKVASDGLCVRPNEAVDRNTFNSWAKDIADLKKRSQIILDNVSSDIAAMEELVTPQAIQNEIYKQLSAEFGDIKTAIDNYQQYVSELNIIENKIMNLVDVTVVNTATTLANTLEENSKWDDLDNSHEYYTHEVNYYDKAEKYFYPTITSRQKKLILSAALQQFFNDTGVTPPKVSADILFDEN